METRNGDHYCYGDKERFYILLWRQGMVHTIALKTRNGSHYCYGDKEWFSLLLWRRKLGLHYCYGDKEWIYLLLWKQVMVHTTVMETRNGFNYYIEIRIFFHYCFK